MKDKVRNLLEVVRGRFNYTKFTLLRWPCPEWPKGFDTFVYLMAAGPTQRWSWEQKEGTSLGLWAKAKKHMAQF